MKMELTDNLMTKPPAASNMITSNIPGNTKPRYRLANTRTKAQWDHDNVLVDFVTSWKITLKIMKGCRKIDHVLKSFQAGIDSIRLNNAVARHGMK